MMMMLMMGGITVTTYITGAEKIGKDYFFSLFICDFFIHFCFCIFISH
jgi:hypothetical protein